MKLNFELNRLSKALLTFIVMIIMYIVSLHSYIAFHTFVELFSIIVAFSLFVIAWNSSEFNRNKYLIFVGIAYFFIGSMDLIHTMAYHGMNVFPDYGNNLPTQLWIGSRYVEAFTLALAAYFVDKKFNKSKVFLVYSFVTAILFATIFMRVFPICYIEGSGLTPFKIVSEYIISSILIIALYLVYKRQKYFTDYTKKLLYASLILTILSEISFTFYVSVYGISNFVGHVGKFFSFYLIYRALIREGLKKPYQTLFKDYEQSLEKYQAIFEGVDDALFVLDINSLEILDVNRKACEMYNYSREEFTQQGMTITDLMVEDEDINYDLDQNTEARPLERKARKKGGETFWTEENPALYLIEDKERLLVSVRDISRRKKAEAEKEKLQEQLLQTQKLESIGSLGGGIAHDYNNKLSVIQGRTEMAMNSLDESDPAYTHLQSALETTQDAAQLTRKILLFSRKQELFAEKIDLNQTLQEMQKVLDNILGEKIKVTRKLDPELWTIEADQDQIEQVIVNLAVNSRDAMPDGGEITISTQSITVDEQKAQTSPDLSSRKYILLQFKDDGQGIEKENIDRIFDPFFTTKGMANNKGMGLSVALGIIKRHNGRIDVESTPGKGTTFRIYLPARVEEEPKKDERKVSSSTSSKADGSILIAEDDPEVLKYLEDVLTQKDYKVYKAKNGREARSIFLDNKKDISLLLSDVIMPDINGVKLAEELQEHKSDLKIILSSGYSDERVGRSKIIEKGYQFIQKPYGLDELSIMINNALAN